MNTLRTAARWLWLSLLIACGAPAAEDTTDAADAPDATDATDVTADPDAAPDLPPPTGLTIEPRVERLRYCEVFAQVLLDMEARCDDRAPDPRQQEHLLLRCQQDTTRPVLQNVVAYDELAAAACLQSLTQVCFLDEADQASCALALRGRLGEGEVCYDDDECDGGHCERDGRCPGRCRVWSAPGQACGQRQCAPGTFCDPAVWTCAQAWPEGATCQQDQDCAAPLACRRAPAARNAQPARACQPRPPRAAQGEPCDDETPCAAHLFCLSEPGQDWSQGGTCAPVAAPGDRCPVGGADLRWFHRGCRDSLCKATDGATEGVCASTRLHEPCVRATWTDPALSSAPRKPDEPPLPLLEAWACSHGWICHDQYHYCRRPEDWELPPLDPAPRACLRP
jgi:hypothetical protein